MRVLIINTSERIGGAAIAAHRLMEALKNNGIKAKISLEYHLFIICIPDMYESDF